MWNPGLARTNRAVRRRAMKYNGDQKLGWQKVKEKYKPSILPIQLGINEYKKEHPGETKRIAYYKDKIWEAYNNLKGAPTEDKAE